MRLKSILLLPIMLSLSVLAVLGLFQGATGGGAAWFGLALAAAPLPTFVTYIMVTESMARTSSNLPLGLALSFAGLALSGFSGGPSLVTGLALLSFAALLWYVFVYSRYGRTPSKTLSLGGGLPDFELFEADGTSVASAAFRDHPSLLLFYRGNWCPLCMAQIKEVADQYKSLADMGVEVVLVSPQPEAETKKLAAKFDVPFRFLIDRNLAAAQALDIYAEGGTPMGVDAMGYGEDTVLPTVIATDAQGKIIFLDETDNYRVRPEPATFLAIFNQQVGPAGVTT